MTHKIFDMPLAEVWPHYLAKVERKGQDTALVETVTCWLTGYSRPDLARHLEGRTDGVRALADRLEAAGHLVFTPDLYDGHRFTTIEEGMTHYQQLTHEKLLARAQAAVAALTGPFVVAGVSLGGDGRPDPGPDGRPRPGHARPGGLR